MNTNPNINRLEQILSPLQLKICNHKVIQQLTNQAAIQCWMQHHVFAVWDFVCLIKALSGRIIQHNPPWFSPKDPESVYLMQQILMEEESDQLPDGQTHGSHFNWYLQAMAQCGADTQPICNLLRFLQNQTVRLTTALDAIELPKVSKAFVRHTFSLFDQPTEVLAAAFVYGREAMTPGLFSALQRQIQDNQIAHCELLQAYLVRHIELDGEEHLPKAQRMLINLCGEDGEKWRRAENAAVSALQARGDLLTGIQTALSSQKNLDLSG
jgi:hypothetical protein